MNLYDRIMQPRSPLAALVCALIGLVAGTLVAGTAILIAALLS